VSRESLLGYRLEDLEQVARDNGLSAFRGRQIARWIYLRRASDFGEMTDLPGAAREELALRYTITGAQVRGHWTGSGGAAEKYLVGFPDGAAVETVLMRYRHGDTLCLSTQVGCAYGCPFCASGADGLVRDLSVEEILAQWYLVQRSLDPLGDRVSRLVYMGSGEPLANYDAVVRSLRLFNSAEGPAIGSRRMTLSTVGVVPGIRALAEESMQVTLAISLHAPNDYLRSQIVPINRRYPLGQLLSAARHYANRTGRRVSFEYAMIRGINDHPDLARELAILLEDTPCHVNLIRFNPVQSSSWEGSDDRSIEQFRDVLSLSGIAVTVRRSIGDDIEGACGQLRRRFGED